MPHNVVRYVLSTSALHQLALLALTAAVALFEVVPLELQRRIVDDLVKHRPELWVIRMCAMYAGPCSSRARLSLRSISIAVGSGNAPGAIYAAGYDRSAGDMLSFAGT